MTKEEINTLTQTIDKISNHFEPKPWTDGAKFLKEDFDINKLETPNHYLETIGKIAELLREARLLFIYSVFNKVCTEESKLYNFSTPYQSNMSYSAVMKKDDTFYLLDEDGDYREIFTSEPFVRFIEDEYWEIYE